MKKFEVGKRYSGQHISYSDYRVETIRVSRRSEKSIWISSWGSEERFAIRHNPMNDNEYINFRGCHIEACNLY